MCETVSTPWTARPLTIQIVLASLDQTFWGSGALTYRKEKVLRRIRDCSTGAYGYTLLGCEDCDYTEWAPAGCRDRHCPTCIPTGARGWIEKRESELLRTAYFHVIATLPKTLRDLALVNPKEMYDLLMRTSRDALLEFFQNRKPLGCVPSLVQVLHTWNQLLEHHPHVHMIVSGGGWNEKEQTWVPCPNPEYLFCGKDLAIVFRGRFLEGLQNLRRQQKLYFKPPLVEELAKDEGWSALVDDLYQQNWNVHLKPPVGGPEQTILYLSRYTHRAAISNRRLLSLEDGMITFSWNDRRANKTSTRTMKVEAFVRLFAVHILPKGFHRVRLAGLLSPGRREQLKRAKTASEASTERIPEKEALIHPPEKPPKRVCPKCGSECMEFIYRTFKPGLRSDQYQEICILLGGIPPPLPSELAAKEASA